MNRRLVVVLLGSCVALGCRVDLPVGELVDGGGGDRSGPSPAATVTWTRSWGETQNPIPPDEPVGLTPLVMPFDPISGTTLLWAGGGPNGTDYPSRMFFYDATPHTFAGIAGTGEQGLACAMDTPTMPGERQPDGMMAVDTRRGRLYTSLGTNGGCAGQPVDVSGTSVRYVGDQLGVSAPAQPAWPFATNGTLVGQGIILAGVTYTVASVEDSTHLTITAPVLAPLTATPYSWPPPNQDTRTDMYFLSLAADPTTDAWTQVVPAHLPPDPRGILVYDPDDDVLFTFGASSGGHAVYCETGDNPQPNVPTVRQQAVGCTSGGDWISFQPADGVFPPAIALAGGWYDTATHKVILFAGQDGTGTTFFNQTWAFDLTTHIWTQKCAGTCSPPLVFAGPTSQSAHPAADYDSVRHLIYYHQITNQGAPADWKYDPQEDSWTLMTSVGGGPWESGLPTTTFGFTILAYDGRTDRLIGWTQDPATGGGDVWEGQIGP